MRASTTEHQDDGYHINRKEHPIPEDQRKSEIDLFDKFPDWFCAFRSAPFTPDSMQSNR